MTGTIPIIPVLTFRTKTAAQPEWTLTEAQIVAWNATYPAVEVFQECRQAQAWLEANPQKCKTARGMPAFLVRWLKRSSERQAALVHVSRAPQLKIWTPWVCPHVEECTSRGHCRNASILGRPLKAMAR